ncbi:MAG: sulfatase-like hydrolase/transferase [Kiritimatiellae bacterium]|nr:sulfatase-like hydrolase/transferase [Kiritimatiellia bacterium]
MARTQPNILFLLNDHQAYYRHGWDGGARPLRPCFDSLAAQGARFDRAYTTCPLCTPARRSMLTGMLPHNHGFVTLNERDNVPQRDQGLLFPYLERQGYDLWYFGKWHSGPGTARDHGCRGFSWPGFGNPYLSEEYDAYTRKLGLPKATFNLDHVFVEPPGNPNKPKPGPGFRCNKRSLTDHVTGTLETPRETHESAFIAHHAIEALSDIAKNGAAQPFCMSVHFYGPHNPYLASPEFIDLYAAADIAQYGSFESDLTRKPNVYMRENNEPICTPEGLMRVPNPLAWSTWQDIMRYVYAQITEVDAAGGRILDALDRLGFTENTLVIWTTDHGDSIASHGGRYGKESYLSEEMLRVPMTLRWPGQVEPGRQIEELVSVMDIGPTLLDAAGTAFPRPTEGRSLLDACSNGRPGTARPWRTDLVVETHGHHGDRVTGRALITDRHKYAQYREADRPEMEWEAYDLKEDPYEMDNLALRSDRKDTVDDLRRRLDRWRTETDDTVEID